MSLLERKRLISFVSRGDKDYLEVTALGRRRLVEYDLDDLVLNTTKRWDGIWRMILFDITHHLKRAGDALQFRLSKLGFYRRS